EVDPIDLRVAGRSPAGHLAGGQEEKRNQSRDNPRTHFERERSRHSQVTQRAFKLAGTQCTTGPGKGAAGEFTTPYRGAAAARSASVLGRAGAPHRRSAGRFPSW